MELQTHPVKPRIVITFKPKREIHIELPSALIGNLEVLMIDQSGEDKIVVTAWEE